MFYMGLDLGKLRDFTAIAVVEREPTTTVLTVRFLERVMLGTPYSRVVKRVADLTRHPDIAGCHLTVDATGVGMPVVEALRGADLGCRAMTAVTITGGERAGLAAPAAGVGEHWHVPKADLLGGIRVRLESGELRIARQMPESGTLVRELLSMRSGRGAEAAADRGGHDDLVLAVALACWQASRGGRAGYGTQRLTGM
jgi:phage FluMu gp28-like protein